MSGGFSQSLVSSIEPSCRWPVHVVWLRDSMPFCLLSFRHYVKKPMLTGLGFLLGKRGCSSLITQRLLTHEPTD